MLSFDAMFGFYGFCALMIGAIFVAYLQGRAMKEFARQMAESAGWIDLKNAFLAVNGVKGMWRQLPAQFGSVRGSEDWPGSFVLKINVDSGAMLYIRPRFQSLISIRLPKFLEPSTPVELPLIASKYWIWGDEQTAERLFSNSKIASLIGQNLTDRFDEIVIYRRGVRIRRAFRIFGAIRSQAVRAEYEPMVRVQFALGEALLEVL